MLRVAGSARLGGELRVKVGGATPRPGDSWTILRAGRGITGRFARVPGGYAVSIAGDRLVLTYAPTRQS